MTLVNKKNKEVKNKADKKSVKVVNKKPSTKESMKDLYKDKGGDAAETKKTETGKFNNAYRILVKPLVTEKASVSGSENKYFFAVSRDANKIEVAKSIKEVYGINPISVNILNVKGKKVRSGKVTGKRKNWKKAIVTLPKGKTIKVYEGV